MITDLEDQFHVNDTLKTSAIGVVKQPRDANRWPWSYLRVFLNGMCVGIHLVSMERITSRNSEISLFSSLFLEIVGWT